MNSIEFIAKILKTTVDVIEKMDGKMSQISGKKNVLDDLIEENRNLIDESLWAIEKQSDSPAGEIRLAMMEKLKKSDDVIYEIFGRPSGKNREELEKLCSMSVGLASVPEGWFLKKEKAMEILKEAAPPNIMKALGYENATEMLKNENFLEVFSALRFVESTEWMHQTFDNVYKSITAADFEMRKIEVSVLNEKWLKIAEKFVKKKYHNLSHLKELGVIFIIPLPIDTPGETARLFSLVLHYLHEITFYSRLFQKYADSPDFFEKLISLLRGDVLQAPVETDDEMRWLIVQRYLAKDNEDDPRLSVPHINPEAVHWRRAQKDVFQLSKKYGSSEFAFWLNMNFVGDYFLDKNKSEDFLSFNLVDNIMMLVMEKEAIKYNYHHHEALWNKIFMSYLDIKTEERLLMENFEKGLIIFKGHTVFDSIK